jgi:hypothetical protein
MARRTALLCSAAKNPFKLVQGEKIFGRALSFGGIEELTEPQIWTNYSKIREKEMLDAASKTILTTDDPTLAAKHPSGLKGINNLEIIERAVNTTIGQVDTYPRSLALFSKAEEEWWMHAQTLGFAHDPMLGVQSVSGTPFRSEAQQYRLGKYAKDLEEQYREWFIPHMVKKITQGVTFLSELSLDEMKRVADNIVIIEANKMIKDRVLAGQDVTQEEIDLHKEVVRKDFMKDNKKFIKILKDELKNASIRVKINIKGKQKNLGLMADKMTNIFRTIFANPQGFMQVMQIPAAAKAFNQMLEASNLSPIDFGDVGEILKQAQQAQQAPQPEMAQPTQPAII